MIGSHAAILFLDFDGVLHPDEVRVHRERSSVLLHAEGHALFESASILEDLLAPYDLPIVLSTSWAQVFSFDYARDQLPPGLRARVVGATFDPMHKLAWRWPRWTRYDQINLDLARRKPQRWLAIDDDALGWPTEELASLVLTPRHEGLRSETARSDLREKLARTFR